MTRDRGHVSHVPEHASPLTPTEPARVPRLVADEDVPETRSADRFRRILDEVAEGVLVLDPDDGRIRDATRGATHLLGAPREAIVGQPIGSFVTGFDAADIRRVMHPVVDGRLEARTIGLTVRQPSGAEVPVEVLLQRIELPGEPPGLVAIARDIRERVDAQHRLRRLADAEHARVAELKAVIRAMGDGVVVCNDVGDITLANPAARDMFPEVVERTYDDILQELDDPDHAAPRLGHHDGPVVLPTRRDRERWVEVATYPVGTDREDGPSGGHMETIVVLRDVTEARQREAVRETFIGVLSHELRTPITTIYGGAKLLGRESATLDEATRRSIFADIAAEAERLQRLVEDVVALNRFGEDGGELADEPVLLQRIVPMVVGSEETRWPGVMFTLVIPPGLPTVAADPTYVEQVVRNLLSNAAKYGGSGSLVEIVVERTEDEVEVRILDDGPGIQPGEVSRLFELFYRSPRHRHDHRGCRDRAVRLRAAGAGDGWPDLGHAAPRRRVRVRVRATDHGRRLTGSRSQPAAPSPDREDEHRQAAHPGQDDEEVVRVVEERDLEVHPHHARQDDGRQEDRRQQRQGLHDAVGVVRDPPHVDVVGPEQRIAQGFDGVDRAVESIAETDPRATDGRLDLHLGSGECRQDVAMGRQGAAHEADPAAQRHDGGEHVVAADAAQRALVELVDLAVDRFGDLEVVGDHLVDEGREQAGGVELAKVRIAIEAVIETAKRPDLAVMDADHDARAAPAGRSRGGRTWRGRSPPAPASRG